MLLADIAVPAPLGRPLSYRVPPELASRVTPGVRVVCELGKRRVLAVVLDAASEREPSFDPAKVKAIAAVLDDEPVIGPELLAFLRELASYYFAPIGEVLRLALPAMERSQVRELERDQEGLFRGVRLQKVGGRRHTVVRLVEPSVVAPAVAAEPGESGAAREPGGAVAPDAAGEPGAVGSPAASKLRGRAPQLMAYLREHGEQPVARLEETFSTARAIVEKLRDLGLVEVSEREEPPEALFADAVVREPPPELTAAQSVAVTALLRALAERQPHGFMLHGVTGSGKTEVYLRAIAACRAEGRGALVLVPEIALTPQLVARFRARFGDDLAVVHSGLAERARHAMWRRLRERTVHVAIGARSALFAPVADLGLVVVDEEHDASFKQEEGIRYHARDMALLRAHRAGAVAVLGSATPSLETEMLTRSGKLTRLDLPDRAHAAAVLPDIEILDLKRFGAGPTGDPLLSLPLHRAIEKALAAGQQTILFLNRRGFAPSVMCASCGEVAQCQICSVALTFHRARGGRVRCHYCDFSGPMPQKCPSCSAAGLTLEGLGTEKLEATIAEAFPTARVARLDRDVASGDKAEVILGRVRRGEVDILVGTQMVTKGHDLPRVTLVGVVNADAALSMPDFRATERGFQLLVQVAGRAGRGDHPGQVIIQTRNPGQAAIRFAANHDVKGFLAHELEARKDPPYPPFSRLALLRFESLDEDAAADEARRVAAALAAVATVRSGEVTVFPVAEAPIFRLRGRYRFRIVLRAKERPALRAALKHALAVAERAPSRVHVIVDIDPVQMM